MQKFFISQKIPRDKVADLLCSALEGGSNYWYEINGKVEGDFQYFGEYNEPKTKYLHLYPFQDGGALYITDARADNPTLKIPVRLDFGRMYKGLQIWADDALHAQDKDRSDSAHARYWGDFIANNTDAETGDIFLQYCIFGKIIYG